MKALLVTTSNFLVNSVDLFAYSIIELTSEATVIAQRAAENPKSFTALITILDINEMLNEMPVRFEGMENFVFNFGAFSINTNSNTISIFNGTDFSTFQMRGTGEQFDALFFRLEEIEIEFNEGFDF